MTLLQGIILGIVQGLTEFLPISSSAHLVLVPHLLGWEIPADQVFPFGVLVQLGTLLAVIVYFSRDLLAIIRAMIRGLVQGKPLTDPNAQLGWLLILATIPAGIIGMLLKEQVENVFGSIFVTSLFLFITAALLVFSERFGKRMKSIDQIDWKDAIIIGSFQALSIFPGLSRSGSTIAGGMTRHLDRPSAGRFAFLMSIPIMFAAGFLSIFDLLSVANLDQFIPVIIAGFIAAAVVGFLSIHWLLRFLVRRSLTPFAIYCILFAILNLIVWYA